ncbi:MAG: Amidophosphoribosyltransferase, partial [uncultured Solirubrobacteraceae bacterium]
RWHSLVRPRRAHHDPARARPGQPGLRRAEAPHAGRRGRRRARPLLDHGVGRVGEHAAGLPLRPPPARAGPQRQPGQRRRAARRAARARPALQLDLGLGDHRRAAGRPPGRPHRGRGRRRHAADARRLLDGRALQGPRRGLPRPVGAAAAVARAPRRPLLRGQRVVRLRHHRRGVPARRPARRGRHARRARHRVADGGRGRARGVLRLRVHLLRPPGLADERPGAPGRARQDGRDPRPRGPGARRRPGHRRARQRQRRGARVRAGGRPAAGRRADQEPLRRADVHPAGSGAAQARPAAEVQPAAGDRRRQVDRRGRRLDRARQHHAADRADAPRRGRARGAHAHLRPADQAPVPVRDRHVHARGDGRPRPHGRRGRRAPRDRLARVPLAGRRLRGGRRFARAALRRLLHRRVPARGLDGREGQVRVRARAAARPRL